MAEGSLIFVTGGVRSGKSSFAEELAVRLASEHSAELHYIACGLPVDEEMFERIKRHQADRFDSGWRWNTWELPVAVELAAPYLQPSSVVLLDCLTTLLNNELFSGSQLRRKQFNQSFDQESSSRLNQTIDQTFVQESIILGIEKLLKNCRYLIIVSNEVLNEPLSGEIVLAYGKALGRLHKRLVEDSERAYLVEAGIPLLMKGE